MFEFEIVQELEPNAEILEVIKDYDYTVRNGKIKHLKATNLQFIEPTEYLITYSTALTIFEYKVNEVRKSKKDLIKKVIESIEISRDEKYNIEIKNIRFTEEFISKNSKEYIKYLNDILRNTHIGFIYKEAITKQNLGKLKEDYYIFYHSKIENKEYSTQEMNEYLQLLEENFYTRGVINCPIIEDKMIIDYVDLIQKNKENLLKNTRIKNSEFWKT